MTLTINTSLVVLLFIVGLSSSARSDTVTARSSVLPPGCLDGTPHKKTLVPVDEGVKVEVLDWGGTDNPDTMVLLTGYGDNAHVYDEFAYQFIDYFHVIGITRRGFLPSSQPKQGSTWIPGHTTT